jgi:NAD(P)-dependent dehydrogenase (short-subunit alcohol dehydrogenase family)
VSRIAGSEVTGGDTWSAADIGDQTGRIALVTGANSGIGYETARALAGHGAHVILACRDEEKARRARDKMESELERSSLELLHLDLADLVSVRRAADEVLSVHARLDLLINNAGVMGTPYRQTADGFELQMATNHLGHFALTGLLLDRILTTERSRVVTVSSHMHRMGRLRPDDVAGVAFHNTWASYGTSKLANLLFTAELSRRLEAAGLRTLALAAHPGWTRSNLAGSGAALGTNRLRRKVARAAGTFLGQSAAGGALPVLCAATSSSVGPGQYIGPASVGGLYGPPRVARPSRRARDPRSAVELWAASEDLTGVHFSVGAPV